MCYSPNVEYKYYRGYYRGKYCSDIFANKMSKILNDIAYFPIQKQMSLTNEEKSYIK